MPILPALFALADETGATGKDFIAAYVAGFEAECKLSMVVNFYQYTKGWHPTTTIGVFGSAAACDCTVPRHASIASSGTTPAW